MPNILKLVVHSEPSSEELLQVELRKKEINDILGAELLAALSPQFHQYFL